MPRLGRTRPSRQAWQLNTNPDIERLRLRILVAEALEAGRLAEEQLQTAADFGESRSSAHKVLQLFRGRGAPSRDQMRRVADTLDGFANKLETLVETTGGADLGVAVEPARRWGEELWAGKRSGQLIYRDLKKTLGTLTRHQTRLLLDESRTERSKSERGTSQSDGWQ